MIEHDNIIYVAYISEIGGVETFVYEMVKKIGVLTADEILVLWRALCLSSVLESRINSLELFRPGSLNGIPTSDNAIFISSFFGSDLVRFLGFDDANVPPWKRPKIGPKDT